MEWRVLISYGCDSEIDGDGGVGDTRLTSSACPMHGYVASPRDVEEMMSLDSGEDANG
jgi:hypothetical protein